MVSPITGAADAEKVNNINDKAIIQMLNIFFFIE
jgi:hypothetical protein